jgi:hypothetical protein
MSGGYDMNLFINPVNEHLECPHCLCGKCYTNVLQNPKYI